MSGHPDYITSQQASSLDFTNPCSHILSLCHASHGHVASVAHALCQLCHTTVDPSSPPPQVREKAITTEDGESVIEQDLVKVAPPGKFPGYDPLNNNPGAHSDGEDPDGLCPDRKQPYEEPASHPASVSTPQPTPTPSPAISASDSQVKKLLESHNLQVDVLKSIGIDPCLEYQQGQATYPLAKVRKGDVICPICSRSCSNAQKLKNHIKSSHQEVAAFRCIMCNKSFGDSNALKVHKAGHRKSVLAKHRCRLCKKGFDSANHLQQHIADHTSQGVTCQFCEKKLAHLRSIASHEGGCKKNPAYQQQAHVREFECSHCNAAYYH